MNYPSLLFFHTSFFDSLYLAGMSQKFHENYEIEKTFKFSLSISKLYRILQRIVYYPQNRTHTRKRLHSTKANTKSKRFRFLRKTHSSGTFSHDNIKVRDLE